MVSGLKGLAGVAAAPPRRGRGRAAPRCPSCSRSPRAAVRCCLRPPPSLHPAWPPSPRSAAPRQVPIEHRRPVRTRVRAAAGQGIAAGEELALSRRAICRLPPTHAPGLAGVDQGAGVPSSRARRRPGRARCRVPWPACSSPRVAGVERHADHRIRGPWQTPPGRCRSGCSCLPSLQLLAVDLVGSEQRPLVLLQTAGV